MGAPGRQRIKKSRACRADDILAKPPGRQMPWRGKAGARLISLEGHFPIRAMPIESAAKAITGAQTGLAGRAISMGEASPKRAA